MCTLKKRKKRENSAKLYTEKLSHYLYAYPAGGTGVFSDVLPSERYLRAIQSVTLSYLFSCFSILSYAYLFYPFFFSVFRPNHLYFFPKPLSYIGFMAPTYGSCIFGVRICSLVNSGFMKLMSSVLSCPVSVLSSCPDATLWG